MSTAKPEDGWFLGIGGAIWRIALPMSEEQAAAHALGQLTRVNEDGTPYTGPALGPSPTEPPSRTAPKRAWLEWAIACGADPEDAAAATKQDLIDAYGNPNAPTATAQETASGPTPKAEIDSQQEPNSGG